MSRVPQMNVDKLNGHTAVAGSKKIDLLKKSASLHHLLKKMSEEVTSVKSYKKFESNVSCHINEGVMSHIRRSHVPRMNESCPT